MAKQKKPIHRATFGEIIDAATFAERRAIAAWLRSPAAALTILNATLDARRGRRELQDVVAAISESLAGAIDGRDRAEGKLR